MAVIDDILKLGREQGSSPQEIATAIDLFHADTSAEIAKAGAGTEESFRALAILDDDRNSRIAQLRTEAMASEIAKQFPDLTEREVFLQTLSNMSPANEGSVVYPPEYEEKSKAINAAGEAFTERRRSHGNIQFGDNYLGSFVERPTGGNNFQFLITPADKDVTFPGTGISVGKTEQGKLLKSVSVDREALVKESQDKVNALNQELDRFISVNGAPTGDTEGDQAIMSGYNRITGALAPEEKLLKFRQEAPLSQLAQMEMIRSLKDDKDFKATIPNDWVEQFTTRPLLGVVRGFGRLGAQLAGDKDVLEAEDPINAIAPGALRNRFEYQGQGEPTADLLSQGVESLITFLAPGGGAKLLAKAPLVGKALQTAEVVTGANAAGKAGFAGFGATAYGNSLSERLQLANNTANPVEAERIRAWAPFLAVADAVKEVITEKLIPGDVESLISRGLSGSFGKRLLNAGLVAPTKEGLEEVAGVGLEQFYQGTPGTPESQNVFQAFRGGFTGGLAFVPAALYNSDKGIRKNYDRQGEPVYLFNGKNYSSKAEAEQASDDLKAKVTEVLKPLGVETREDAGEFLLNHARQVQENPDAVTQDDYDAAAFVSRVAADLPAAPAVQENAPSSVGQTEEEGASAVGVAAPVGGIAPDSNVTEIPATPENVNQENLPTEGGLKVLQKFDLGESERLISTTRAGDERSKNEGRVRPEGLKSPVSLVELPVSGFTPETLEFVRTSTDEGRVTKYTQEGVETPVYVGVKKDGSFFIKDGGHRLMAKVNQGGNTIQAYITQDDLNKLGQQQTPVSNPVEAPAAAATPERAVEISRFAPNIKYYDPDTSTVEGQVLDQFTKTTGTRIVNYTADARPDGRITNGFVVPGDPNTIYINRNAAQPMLHVLMHEFFHSREDMPEYKEFAEALKTIEPEAWGKASQLFPQDEAKALSEFAADVFGSRGTEKEFWDRLNNIQEKMEPGLFRKFAQYLASVWESIKQKVGYDRYVQVRGAEEVDRRIANLLRLAAPETGTTEQAAAEAPIKEGALSDSGRFSAKAEQEAVDRFKGVSQSETPRIQVESRGRQSGFGFGPDLDLYNIVQPGSSVDGTTFAVEAGATPAEVQQRAREKFTEAGETPPGEIQQSESTQQPFDRAKALDVEIVGGHWLEQGVTGYDEWKQKITERLGPEAEQYLRRAYENLRFSGLPNVSQMTKAFDIDNPGPQVRQAPELTPQQEAVVEAGGVAAANAVTDEIRKRTGLDPAEQREAVPDEEVLALANGRQKEDDKATDKLIEELAAQLENPRAVTSVELAMLDLQNVTSRKKYKEATRELAAAEEAGDLKAKGEAMEKLGLARQEVHIIQDILKAIGSEQGRAFRFRQVMISQDYELVQMEYNYQAAANQGGPLNEKQQKDVVEANKKIEEAQKAVTAAEEADLDARIQLFLDQFFKQRAAAAASITTPFKLKAAAAGAKERLKAALKPIAASEIQQSTSLSAEVLNDLSLVGADYIQDGATTLEAFQARLQTDFGNQFDDSIQFIYEAAQEFQRSLSQKVTGKKAAAKKGAVKATVDIASNGKDAPDRQTVKELVRLEVESGKRGTKEVFDAVFAALTKAFPKLTMRELKEIFSNYGNAVFPSKDEVKTQLRELHRLAQLEVTLERLQTGLETLKSGPQRDKVSGEVRAMQRQIADLKKKLGVDQKSEEQLAGALTAAKNRIRNQIEDLNRQIAAGGRTPEERATRPAARVDDELKSLQKQRDDLQKTLTQLEGKKPLSMEKRVELAIAALERSEEELTRRLEAREFKRSPRTEDTVTSEEIEERRSYNATLRQALKEGRDALRTRKSPAQRALDAAVAAVDRFEGIMAGTIVPEPRAPKTAQSQQEEDLRLYVDAMKQVLAEERRAAAAAKKPSEAQRRIDAAQKQLDKAQADLDEFTRTGTLPKPTRFSAVSKIESDIRSKAEAVRKDLRERQQAAEAPQQQEDAARAERDRLERVLEGTEAPRTAAPAKPALTQAVEDFRLEIAAMRQQLREEAAEKKRKPAEQKQYEAAQKTLNRLEDLLTGAPAPTGRTQVAPLSDRVAETRERIITARQELAAQRAADPTIYNQRQTKAVETRTAALQARLGHFKATKELPRPKAVVEADATLKKARANYVAVQNEWNKELFLASLESRNWFQKAAGAVGQSILSARLIELGLDGGTILRQGGRVIGRPLTTLKAVKNFFTSLTENRSLRSMEELRNHSLYNAAVEAGVEFTVYDPTKPDNQEELYMSRIFARPVFKATDKPWQTTAKRVLDVASGPVRGTAQAQTAALNWIRMDQFEGMYQTLSRFGAPSLEEMKHYAVMVNASTGRASMTQWEKSGSEVLSLVFLAYRWSKSGLQYLVGHPLWMPIVRGEATARSTAVVAAEYARNLAGIGMIYASFLIARGLRGSDDDDKWKIEWDPRSSRFAKIPIGDSLLDPTAGIAQWATFLTKMTLGEKKTQTGRITSLSKPEPGQFVTDENTPAKGEGRGTEALRFLRNKLNPLIGAAINVTVGENPVGERTNFDQEAQRLVTPLILRDVQDAFTKHDVWEGTGLALLSFFGMGINNFEETRREKVITEDRAWLYNTQISLGQLSDDTTRGAMLGFDKADSEKRQLNRTLTDAERKATLEKSLPAVQEALKQARESYKTLPTENREKGLERIQDRLDERVKKARERAYKTLYPRD